MELAVIANESLERCSQRDWLIRTTVLFLAVMPLVSFAQEINLTPEQQLMLNALPPAQRQQALDAIQNRQAKGPDGQVQSINEDLGAEKEYSIDGDEEQDFDWDLRANPRSRLVIKFTPLELLSFDEDEVAAFDATELDPVQQRLIGSHLFILDENGVLSLQGLELIQLLGLSEEDIQRRLEAESLLSPFGIEVRILGQEPIGVEALEPFVLADSIAAVLR